MSGMDWGAALAKAENQRDDCEARVAYLTDLLEKVITVHEQVVMDTPEDRALHREACKTFRDGLTALALVRARP